MWFGKEKVVEISQICIFKHFRNVASFTWNSLELFHKTFNFIVEYEHLVTQQSLENIKTIDTENVFQGEMNTMTLRVQS